LYLQILAMALSSAIAPVGWLMTLETTIFRVRSLTTTLTTKTWSFQVMKRLARNETLDIKVYHRSLQIACPLSWTKAYMTFQMASCVAIHWPPNGQWIKCVLDVSNSCPFTCEKTKCWGLNQIETKTQH
jgi:hypothetical protein